MTRLQLRVRPKQPSVSICRVIERIEAESAFSQHRCAPPDEARRLRMRSARIGAGTVVLTRSSVNLYYNRWIGAGQAGPTTERQIDRFVELARDHGVASVGVTLTPGSRPTMASKWLEARGFRPTHPGAKLWRDTADLSRVAPSLEVRVRRVSAAETSTWVDIVAQVWRTFGSRRSWFEARSGAPGWHHYVAWIDEKPVGAGALFVGDVGSTTAGHLVDGVTLPAWRRRGVQAAVIRKRISQARKLKCTILTSETAAPLPRMPLVSFRNLRRQGFEFAYLRESWRLDLKPS